MVILRLFIIEEYIVKKCSIQSGIFPILTMIELKTLPSNILLDKLELGCVIKGRYLYFRTYLLFCNGQ